jgi:hypothetical protein
MLVATLRAVFVDTFNKIVIFSFDNIITVASVNSSLARLINLESETDLTDAELIVQQYTRQARIDYKTSEMLISAIDRLISQGLPLRLEIQPDAFTFSSEVANATGSFVVNYYCKQACCMVQSS